MRAHAFLNGRRVNSSSVDARLDELLQGCGWIANDDVLRVRLGLHELVVNIRDHAYGGDAGPIDIGMTATRRGLTISVTDWGRSLVETKRLRLPHLSAGGYGLAIIDGCFDEVAYRRDRGRNRWTLRLHRGESATR